jgi:predicted nucleic acid-binding protein
MSVRVALDTNILVYAEGVNGEERGAIAHQLLKEFAEEDVIVPVQALAELFTVLTRKARWPVTTARAAVLGWYDAYACVATSSSVLLDAMELAAAHGFALWDAIMLAASAQAGCRHFLSEDMEHGFTWRGLTIRNPFPSAS